MNSFTEMPADAQPLAADLREQLLAPFIEAVQTALRELAGTDAVERFAYQARSRHCRGDLVAMIDLSSATMRCLTLGFTTETATELARRFLSETAPIPDGTLVRDCAGEIANVTSGQAKALLHGTPNAFTFGTPRIAPTGELPRDIDKSLVAVLATDVGAVVLQLFVGEPGSD
jgi:CheY-specific phosphatase CheX